MNKPMCETSTEVLEHINPDKPVKCYRNLHKNCISVQQDGLVKCHAHNIILQDGKFVINEKGRDKVRETKCKNVHAFVVGMVVEAKVINALPYNGYREAYYNPYKCDTWEEHKTMKPLKGAAFVDIDIDECDSNVLMKDPIYV